VLPFAHFTLKLEVFSMKGRISNYRRGVHTEYTNQYVVVIDGVKDRASANGIMGKRVSFKTETGKEIVGKVSKAHGNNGAVLARFDKGLPGQAVGCEVDIS
jgi:large subunit ribosomal protein L35Ae